MREKSKESKMNDQLQKKLETTSPEPIKVDQGSLREGAVTTPQDASGMEPKILSKFRKAMKRPAITIVLLLVAMVLALFVFVRQYPKGHIATFPTGHLTYQIPSGWKAKMTDDSTKQTSSWAYPEFVIDIHSPTTIKIPPLDFCGLPCSEPTYAKDFSIYVSDYGAADTTNIKDWVQSQSVRTFPNPDHHSHIGGVRPFSDISRISFINTTFDGKPSTCLAWRSSLDNSLEKNTSSFNNLPNNLQAIISYRCYTYWKKRIYQISVTDNSVTHSSTDDSPIPIRNLPRSVSRDRKAAIAVLNSFHFK